MRTISAAPALLLLALPAFCADSAERLRAAGERAASAESSASPEEAAQLLARAFAAAGAPPPLAAAALFDAIPGRAAAPLERPEAAPPPRGAQEPPAPAAGEPEPAVWTDWLAGAWRTTLASAREEIDAVRESGGEALWQLWRATGLSEPFALWRAREYLRSRPQGADGSWASGWAGGWNNAHVRVATTAMILEALEGGEGREDRRARRRGLRFLRTHGALSPEEIERLGNRNISNSTEPYALAYALSYLVRASERAPEGRERDRLRAAVRRVLRRIGTASYSYGDWEDWRPETTTFQLALLAQSLQRAEAAGFEMPERRTPDEAEGRVAPDEDALRVILRVLNDSRDRGNGSFPYYVGSPASREGAALRSPLIEHVLYQAGLSNRRQLAAAAERFMSHHEEFVRTVLKPGRGAGHGGRHGWAEYYYPYGIRGMSYLLKDLHEAGDERAAEWASALTDAVLRRQGADGAWRFSAHFGDTTDTATFVEALDRLDGIVRDDD